MPYPFSDLYDALDVFPEDTLLNAGGDGLIRFLDWQVILLRSLLLDTGEWSRGWAGVRVPGGSLAPIPNSPAETLNRPSEAPAWTRDAVITSEPIGNVLPGVRTEVPVYVTVHEGLRISGLAFRATLLPNDNAPDVREPLQFFVAANLPTPVQSLGLSPNVLLCGWPLVPNHSFDPPLVGRTLLGHIRFILPVAARFGESYTLRFANADGSPDLTTQYEFETRPAAVWVQTPAPQKAEILSDEWKTHFFGNELNASIGEGDDPDLDGFSNFAEYLAGTDPTDANSRFRIEVQRESSAQDGMVLRWLTTFGRTYALEMNTDLTAQNWTVVEGNIPGDGRVRELRQSGVAASQSFYRLSIQISP